MADYNSSYTGAQIDANLAKANTAVQPGALATVATTGAYSDLTGKPTLGTAAAAATGDFATAAQGAKADTSVQSVITGITGADAITNCVSLTAAEYAAIGTKSATTLYIIAGYAMPVSLGTLTIAAMYLGTTAISSGYLGTTQVFGGGTFSPSSLFASSEPGVWYDPSDLTTLFTDTAGTTPVTTPGQTVALMLDKSKGLALGTELVTNGDFSSATGWTAGAGWTISSGVATRVADTVASGVSRSISLTGGVTYQLTYTVTSYTSGNFLVRFTGGTTVNGTTRVGTGTFTEIIVAATGNNVIDCRMASGSGALTIDNISVKELAGNHATQATAASRPTYGVVPTGGRRNTLTFSEQFDNAIWSRTGFSAFGSGSVANTTATLDPIGGNTSDLLLEDTSAGNHQTTQSHTSVVGSSTVSVYAKWPSGVTRNIVLRPFNASGAGHNKGVIFSPSGAFVAFVGNTGADPTYNAESIGNGWWRFSVTGAATAAAASTAVIASASGTAISYTGDGTSGLYLQGAQLELGSTATAYQRVSTAFDVTEAGVQSLSYLSFDGVDDFMVTGTITPGIDRAQVFAGVRKLSDAAGFPIIAEHGVRAATGSLTLGGTFTTNTATYHYASQGTNTVAFASPASYPAPITSVLTGFSDIAGDVARLRVNGTQVAESLADQGTGNYLPYSLYIGRRGGTTLPFSGNIYSIITRFGANLDAAAITNTEAWVAGKTGVTL